MAPRLEKGDHVLWIGGLEMRVRKVALEGNAINLCRPAVYHLWPLSATSSVWTTPDLLSPAPTFLSAP